MGKNERFFSYFIISLEDNSLIKAKKKKPIYCGIITHIGVKCVMMIVKRLREGGLEVSSCKFLRHIRSVIILLKTDL